MPINSFLYPAPSTPTFGYNVANSLRFNSGSSDYLNFSQGNGNRRTFTWSSWVKRAALGTGQMIWHCNNVGHYSYFYFHTDDTLHYYDIDGSTQTVDYKTNRLFRDVSAWYHLVLRVDTTQASSGDRIRIYVNGVQETSFSASQTPSQNTDLEMNVSGHTFRIGTYNNSSLWFDGYLAECVFCDGQSLAPTSFGEFDSDSSTIWKPIDASDLTFGTNGFYLDFEDSSALGNDVSGENNDFSVGNLTSIDQSTDTCTNNFATMNPIAFDDAGDRLLEGNLRFDGTSSSAHSLGIGTIAVNQGKWWFEAELDAVGGTYPQIGVRSVDVNNTVANYVGEITGGVGYFSAGGSQIDASVAVEGGGYATYTSGDIINVGLDLDNNKIYWYKNGTLVNSGGTTITNRFYTFAVSQYSNTGHWFCNFGAGTIYSISSGNADGNGYGNFEHAPPSGYFSLCTKNLAEFG